MFFKRKKKNVFPEVCKYKKGDYVNFRYRGDLYFGYIYEGFVSGNGVISYTIQIAGQCPSFIRDYKEEDIIGIKNK